MKIVNEPSLKSSSEKFPTVKKNSQNMGSRLNFTSSKSKVGKLFKKAVIILLFTYTQTSHMV